MPDYEKLRKNLEREGFAVSLFDTAAQAMDYLDGKLDGTTIGFGGSQTVREMGLFDRLAAHNRCFWHKNPDTGAYGGPAGDAPVYICSANGLAETGEVINIDGVGNRVAATIYGHDTVYLVVGRNKIAPDYDSALWRARNIAGPLNARRLNKKTPCAVGESKCHDCHSPERICAALVVFWHKPMLAKHMEIVLVDEELGF